MAPPTQNVLKLKDWLLTERPSQVDSANKLARRFNVDRKQAERQLVRAGYVKATDGPVWTLAGSANPDTLILTIDKKFLLAMHVALQVRAKNEEETILDNYTDADTGELLVEDLTVDCSRLLAVAYGLHRCNHLRLDGRGFTSQ